MISVIQYAVAICTFSVVVLVSGKRFHWRISTFGIVVSVHVVYSLSVQFTFYYYVSSVIIQIGHLSLFVCGACLREEGAGQGESGTRLARL